MAELGIQPFFNIPYTPEYNPIENYWGVLKGLYKKKRLIAFTQQEKFKSKKTIIDCLREADRE